MITSTTVIFAMESVLDFKNTTTMKTYIYIKFALATLFLSQLTSCYYMDDDYDDYQNPTDFDSDISNITNFYLETPVELEIINNNSVNDTLVYQVGDTIKLKLELDAIFQEAPNERYDLYKSTQSDTFVFRIDPYNFSYSNTEYLDEYMIDLNLLNEYPHLKNLSKEEIFRSPHFDLFTLGNTHATYNSETKKYESFIGIVALNKTGIHEESGDKRTISIYLNNYIYNSYNYNSYNYDSEIRIHIPIISSLSYKKIVIE